MIVVLGQRSLGNDSQQLNNENHKQGVVKSLITIFTLVASVPKCNLHDRKLLPGNDALRPVVTLTPFWAGGVRVWSFMHPSLLSFDENAPWIFDIHRSTGCETRDSQRFERSCGKNVSTAWWLRQDVWLVKFASAQAEGRGRRIFIFRSPNHPQIKFRGNGSGHLFFGRPLAEATG